MTVPVVTVEDVFAYYSDELVPLLALQHAVADEFYIEILNEIRNAFTHLARIFQLPDHSSADSQRQLLQAKNHIRRAALDCVKICILKKAEEVEKFLVATMAEYPLPKSINEEARALRTRRIELSAAEAVTLPDDIVQNMKVLFDQFDTFLAKLQTEYGSYYHEASASVRRRGVWKERGFGALSGFLVGLLGSALFLAATDDNGIRTLKTSVGRIAKLVGITNTFATPEASPSPGAASTVPPIVLPGTPNGSSSPVATEHIP